MRGLPVILAVLLAACLGYAAALWVHDLPPTRESPAEPRTRPPVARTTAPPRPAVPSATPRRAPRVRAAFRRLGEALGAVRLALEEQALRQAGWRRFEHVVPETIAYRGHDFLRAVEAASTQRWFPPAERARYARAREAWHRTQAHEARLRDDRAYRAGEQQLANLAHDPRFAPLHLVTHAAPPFLFVYVDRKPLSPWALARGADAPAARADVARRRLRAERVLRRNAAVALRVRHELRQRYAQALALPPLTAPYGGRADYPYGVRSFADGVVLVSVTYADAQTLRSSLGAPPWPGMVRQGFQHASGLLLGLPQVDGEETTPFWSSWYGRETAEQLLFWYARQRNRWRLPRVDQGFATAGIAAWLGAVQLDARGRAAWSGVAGRRLQDMQHARRRMERRGRAYPLFPVRQLVGFSGHGDIGAWAAATWHLSPEVAHALFREQAWALAHFLTREDGPYRGAFQGFLGRVLARETGPQLSERAFAESFRLQDPDDWLELDRAFAAHVRARLMKQSVLPYLRDPPPLEAWGR